MKVKVKIFKKRTAKTASRPSDAQKVKGVVAEAQD